ncbi:DUF6087 family protein [Streptomyces lomondensis]|uniref:Uncharacterized protein n=1 Tax=Streptomyces lomondensis TaxID=68229 RepID=A0ABQ2X1U7_9ACTN|nr:DUF6087 family protein [Streptomyces lomondensis]MCF0081594.1 DUF6087 family protein [Streptomyces lomondensis]GGW92470.1 hypothetical protein GCM10010383_23010 [Streptomyces lomondensis]
MDDEPLKDWAERRDARIGRLRAVPVVSSDGPRGSHLQPDAPRVIERWNGHAWEPYAYAADLTEAKALLYPEANGAAPAGPAPKPLGPGTGKHRRPPAPR